MEEICLGDNNSCLEDWLDNNPFNLITKGAIVKDCLVQILVFFALQVLAKGQWVLIQ